VLSSTERKFHVRYLQYSTLFIVSLVFQPILACAKPIYPAHPITLIVPFVAGGSSDVIARAVARGLEKEIGQPIVVENRGGGSGAIGTAAAAKAAPDGYTILLGHTTALAVLPNLRANLNYVVSRDFVPITLLGATLQILVVHPSVAKTIGEFVKRAKAEPGTLNYASGGIATPPHLAGELFKQQAQVDIVHIPFNGSPTATTALLGGHVHALFQNIDSIMPYIKSGEVTALAISGENRSPYLPDVPTFEEAGISGLVNKSWFSLVAPAKTPPAVLKLLQEKSRAVVESKEFHEFLGLQIAEPMPAGPEALLSFLNEENQRWARVLKNAAIKAD
jgi:tripartite-type tricarboxylate transporter receptor subunit TctC